MEAPDSLGDISSTQMDTRLPVIPRPVRQNDRGGGCGGEDNENDNEVWRPCLFCGVLLLFCLFVCFTYLNVLEIDTFCLSERSVQIILLAEIEFAYKHAVRSVTVY